MSCTGHGDHSATALGRVWSGQSRGQSGSLPKERRRRGRGSITSAIHLPGWVQLCSALPEWTQGQGQQGLVPLASHRGPQALGRGFDLRRAGKGPRQGLCQKGKRFWEF